MANIFDYMKWRDISLNKVEFNEVDNLILSRLSYFPFDGVVDKDEEITLKEVNEMLKNKFKEEKMVLSVIKPKK